MLSVWVSCGWSLIRADIGYQGGWLKETISHNWAWLRCQKPNSTKQLWQDKPRWPPMCHFHSDSVTLTSKPGFLHIVSICMHPYWQIYKCYQTELLLFMRHDSFTRDLQNTWLTHRPKVKKPQHFHILSSLTTQTLWETVQTLKWKTCFITAFTN